VTTIAYDRTTILSPGPIRGNHLLCIRFCGKSLQQTDRWESDDIYLWHVGELRHDGCKRHATVFAYDVSGISTTRRTPRDITRYTYDDVEGALRRPTPVQHTSFSYDNNSNLLSATTL